jgi:apolipoprotein N-acyltransferase
MRKIEDFMNRLSDIDWGWWPVLSLRPPKDRDIDSRVLFKISPIFGGMAGLIILLWVALRHETSTVGKVVIFYLLGCVAFFAIYKFTFAYFWNHRARRLRSNQA